MGWSPGHLALVPLRWDPLSSFAEGLDLIRRLHPASAHGAFSVKLKAVGCATARHLHVPFTGMRDIRCEDRDNLVGHALQDYVRLSLSPALLSITKRLCTY